MEYTEGTDGNYNGGVQLETECRLFSVMAVFDVEGIEGGAGAEIPVIISFVVWACFVCLALENQFGI